jgi:hypothetical protein
MQGQWRLQPPTGSFQSACCALTCARRSSTYRPRGAPLVAPSAEREIGSRSESAPPGTSHLTQTASSSCRRIIDLFGGPARGGFPSLAPSRLLQTASDDFRASDRADPTPLFTMCEIPLCANASKGKAVRLVKGMMPVPFRAGRKVQEPPGGAQTTGETDTAWIANSGRLGRAWAASRWGTESGGAG